MTNDEIRMKNGSIHGKPQLIASGKGDDYERIYDKSTWQRIIETRDQIKDAAGGSQ